MSGDLLDADVERYRQAAALNAPPPQIVSDIPVPGGTPIEQLLRILGIAANMGDPSDDETGSQQHAERDAKTTAAAEKFAAQDELAAGELDAFAGDDSRAAAMAQQLPQMASTVAGALAGAIGGALAPLAQFPQQAGQGLQQAVQAGFGLVAQAAGEAAPLEDAGLAAEPIAGEFAEPADPGGDPGGGDPWGPGGGDPRDDLGAGGFGGGYPGTTSPTAFLGPAPLPSASTAPSSAPITPVAAPSAAAGTPAASPGMAGMPMVPPPAVAGPGDAKDAKTPTKRVSVPPVRNGAPVQGRLNPPAPLPRTAARTEAKPVVTRRVLAPEQDR